MLSNSASFGARCARLAQRNLAANPRFGMRCETSSTASVRRTATAQISPWRLCGQPQATSVSPSLQFRRTAASTAFQRGVLAQGRQSLGRRLILSSALGTAILFGCGTGPAAVLSMGSNAIRCESSVAAAAMVPGKAAKTPAAATAELEASDGDAKKEAPVRAAVSVLGGAACILFLVGIWAATLSMPILTVWAAYTARWRIFGALIATYILPHVVPIPKLGLGRGALIGGCRRWFGPPGSIRIIALDKEHGNLEPEPEPGVKGERRRLLYCLHPHGIFTFGTMLLLDERPEVRILSSPFLYNAAPMMRLAVRLVMGWEQGSVGRSELTRQMKRGDSPLALVPGGFHEATIACPGTERVFLKDRKGFVKYALRHGYDLVPCYLIGESDLMSNPQGAWRFRFFLNDLSLPAVIPWGYLPMFPRRNPLTFGIGSPVRLPQLKEPTNEDVTKYHEQYMEAVANLYDKIKIGTLSEGRSLEIW